MAGTAWRVSSGSSSIASSRTEVSEHEDDPAAMVYAQLTRYWQRISRLQELSARVATIASHRV
jgi:hypothetical protein